MYLDPPKYFCDFKQKRSKYLHSLKLTAKAPENRASQKETIVVNHPFSRVLLFQGGYIIPNQLASEVCRKPTGKFPALLGSAYVLAR